MKPTDVFKRLDIWVIDPNEDDSKLTIEALNQLGIKTCQNFPDFRSAVRETSGFHSLKLPDLIISEWYEEDFTSMSFLQMLKDNQLPSVPLVILTRNDRKAIRVKNIRIRGFLKKPVNHSQLEQAILDIFKNNMEVRTRKSDSDNLLYDLYNSLSNAPVAFVSLICRLLGWPLDRFKVRMRTGNKKGGPFFTEYEKQRILEVYNDEVMSSLLNCSLKWEQHFEDQGQ